MRISLLLYSRCRHNHIFPRDPFVVRSLLSSLRCRALYRAHSVPTKLNLDIVFIFGKRPVRFQGLPDIDGRIPNQLEHTVQPWFSCCRNSLPHAQDGQNRGQGRWAEMSSDSLSVTVWDFETWLQVPPRIHKAPFVLPVLITFVVRHLPRFIKGLEPLTRSDRPRGKKGIGWVTYQK